MCHWREGLGPLHAHKAAACERLVREGQSLRYKGTDTDNFILLCDFDIEQQSNNVSNVLFIAARG